MSKDTDKQFDLTGDGASYIRVSDDQQDTLRQFEAIHNFEERHGVTIPAHQWFKDEGWARDTADRRPDFQRLMKMAESGKVRWIVVSERDRFGTRDADEFIHFRYLLREWGCRLYDAAGTDWTRKDIATVITAVVDGEKSEQEQHGISKRTLGGKIAKAREGEWQGGPVRLGLEVVCFHRETNAELWRVIFEGRHKRLKVYPGERWERFDGEDNFPRFQPLTEVLRLAPCKDKAKVEAAVSVFERYAQESISFTTLAHYLNGLGYRTGFGGKMQGHQVESMLQDPIYLGYYTYNRQHFGKFHRWANGQTVLELNYEEKGSSNDKADWVQSRRLFPPLVDQRTWNAVQRKLEQRSKRGRAPRAAELYLAGLIYCGNCGARMVASSVRKATKFPRKDGHIGKRFEFTCGSYFKAVRDGCRDECKCLRNGVFQDVLEEFINRYLEETGKRLDLLTQRPDGDHMTARLEGQQTETWRALCDGIDRLTGYLAQHHPAEFAAIVEEDRARRAEERAEELASRDSPGTPPGVLDRFGDTPSEAIEAAVGRPISVMPSDPYVSACLDAYKANFDPAVIDAEIKRLDAEHDRQSDLWANPPTPGTREKAKKRLLKLEADIEELKRQREDVGGVVERYCRLLYDLQAAIAEAKLAMRSEAGERALRQRAEAIRAVIQRIECTFKATGQRGSGWGKKNTLLASVTIYPVAGDFAAFPAENGPNPRVRLNNQAPTPS